MKGLFLLYYKQPAKRLLYPSNLLQEIISFAFASLQETFLLSPNLHHGFVDPLAEYAQIKRGLFADFPIHLATRDIDCYKPRYDAALLCNCFHEALKIINFLTCDLTTFDIKKAALKANIALSRSPVVNTKTAVNLFVAPVMSAHLRSK